MAAFMGKRESDMVTAHSENKRQQRVIDVGCSILYNPMAVLRLASMIGVLGSCIVNMVNIGLATPRLPNMQQLVVAPSAGKPHKVRVLASDSVRFGCRPGEKPDPLCLGGFVTWTRHKPMVVWQGCNRPVVPYYGFYNFRSSLAWIKFLGSDRIMTWSVRKLFSFSSSFTSRLQNSGATNIGWVALKYRQIWYEIRGFSIPTQQIFFALRFWTWEVNVRPIIQNLYTDHVTIRSELGSLIAAKVMRSNWRVFGGKAGRTAMVRVFTL